MQGLRWVWGGGGGVGGKKGLNDCMVASSQHVQHVQCNFYTGSQEPSAILVKSTLGA